MALLRLLIFYLGSEQLSANLGCGHRTLGSRQGIKLRTNYVLIDFENVQPAQLAALDQDHFKVMLFVGAHQAKLPYEVAAAIQRLGSRLNTSRSQGTVLTRLISTSPSTLVRSLPLTRPPTLTSSRKTKGSIRSSSISRQGRSSPPGQRTSLRFRLLKQQTQSPQSSALRLWLRS